MSEIHKIKNVSEYLLAVNKCYTDTDIFKGCKKHLFFRGQGQAEWGLVPSLMREQLNEKSIVLDFHHFSASHGIDYKLDEDIVSLLEDMQHSEIPTRLLDWSVAPLHALFFAVSGVDKDTTDTNKKEESTEDNKEKGCAVVYVLNPWQYNNDILQKNGKSYNTHPKIQDAYIYARSLLSIYKVQNIDLIKDEVFKRYSIKLDNSDFEDAFAFVSNYTNKRVHSQKGVFTIHGTNQAELKNTPLFIKNSHKILIDKDYKKSIYEELHHIFINEYSIYPDLVGMKKLFNRKKGLFNL